MVEANEPDSIKRVSAAMSARRQELIGRPLSQIWDELARVALAAAPSPVAWQPIETAPRDGTEFQAWFVLEGSNEGFWEPQCRFEPETGEFMVLMEFGWDTYPAATPTHWMPIPSSPTGGA